jgi:hypothetical protein
LDEVPVMRLPRARFTILEMAAAVALVGLAVAALRDPTDLWTRLSFTLAILGTAIAVLGAIVRHGPDRPLWLGWALFAGGYLILAFGPWLGTEVRPHLLTTGLLEWLYPRVQTTPMLTATQRGHAMLRILGGGGNYSVESAEGYHRLTGSDLQMNFERIGHSLTAMASGLFGVVLVRVLSPRRDHPS